jgi:hemolysin activation/secretion protein
MDRPATGVCVSSIFLMVSAFFIFTASFSLAQEDLTEHFPVGPIFIREIRVTGSSIFSQEELERTTASYVNRTVTAEELEELRRELTLIYVNKGYISSGAIIPDQTIIQDSIRIHIVEGSLSEVDVEGCRKFDPQYFEKRLRIATAPPVNINSLQRRLQLFQQDPRIRQINSELKPGNRPGEAMLTVSVKEENPLRFRVAFNNYRPPSIGSEQGLFIMDHQNFLGIGDIFHFAFGLSEDFESEIDLNYTLPINAYDTTASIRFRKADFAVIEEAFEPLDITSKSKILEFTLRHPIYRSPRQEFALAITGGYLQNESFLLNIPFDFGPGTEDGKAVTTVLRFSQEWTFRTRNQVVAARSRFNVGVDALDATTIENSTIPDSKFVSWRGQFQWARHFDFLDSQVVFRTDLQLANESLPSLERIAVGGRYSVRGYRENLFLRDEGLIASLESHIPLIRDKNWADVLQLVPFMDYGWAENKDLPTADPRYITSIGVGLQWEATLLSPYKLNPRFEIFWGIPLRDVETSEWNLQDVGIHFQFSLGFI